MSADEWAENMRDELHTCRDILNDAELSDAIPVTTGSLPTRLCALLRTIRERTFQLEMESNSRLEWLMTSKDAAKLLGQAGYVKKPEPLS